MVHWKNMSASIVWQYFGNIVEKDWNFHSFVQFHSMEIFKKYSGHILEIKLPYCGRGPVFSSGEVNQARNRSDTQINRDREAIKSLYIRLRLSQFNEEITSVVYYNCRVHM